MPDELLESIKKEICIFLGYDPEHPPVLISSSETAKTFRVKPGTLDHWASTGRYNLPFVKVGRTRQYTIHDAANHILKQRRTSTHEAKP